MRAILINSTGTEPVALSEAKDHCYVTGTRWDSYIENLISAAREWAEGETWKLIMAGTYEVKLDSFPDSDILEIEQYPIKSIDSIEYVDSAGVTQSITDFESDIESYTARIQAGWPTVKDQPSAVTITVTGGYDGATPRLTVPEKIRQAMLLTIKHWFDNRTSVMVGEGQQLDVKEVPQTAKMLLGFETLRTFV